jgi:hypothetical protein
MCLGKVLVPHRLPHPPIGRGTAGFRELASAAVMPGRLGEAPRIQREPTVADAPVFDAIKSEVLHALIADR